MSALFVEETSLPFLLIKNRDEWKSGLAAILFLQTVKQARTKGVRILLGPTAQYLKFIYIEAECFLFFGCHSLNSKL